MAKTPLHGFFLALMVTQSACSGVAGTAPRTAQGTEQSSEGSPEIPEPVKLIATPPLVLYCVFWKNVCFGA